MSDPNATLVGMKKECPRHEGNFDCTPFCRICEGNQEYTYTGMLPCINFGECGTEVAEDTWHEELGMCVDCSHRYFDHELDLIGL